jgi:hypothetical protein
LGELSPFGPFSIVRNGNLSWATFYLEKGPVY